MRRRLGNRIREGSFPDEGRPVALPLSLLPGCLLVREMPSTEVLRSLIFLASRSLPLPLSVYFHRLPSPLFPPPCPPSPRVSPPGRPRSFWKSLEGPLSSAESLPPGSARSGTGVGRRHGRCVASPRCLLRSETLTRSLTRPTAWLTNAVGGRSDDHWAR